MNLSHAFAVLLIAAVPTLGEAADWKPADWKPAGWEAADWRYSLGVHDFYVPDVNSDTYGLNAGVSVDRRSDTGQHLFGSFDIFWDRDKDHLDPDHIPIWWQLHAGSDGDFWRYSQMRFGWTADFNTRINTASGIERQITALPALVGGYDGQFFQASLEAGAGWFLLTIDDDAPRGQGYGRDGLRNSTLAYAATANVKLKPGESWTLSGRARRWWDNDQTLESQFTVELRGNVSRWLDGHSMKNTELVLSADFYQYNLNVYNQPNLPPVLRWNDDALFRLSLETRW